MKSNAAQAGRTEQSDAVQAGCTEQERYRVYGGVRGDRARGAESTSARCRVPAIPGLARQRRWRTLWQGGGGNSSTGTDRECEDLEEEV